MNKKIILLIVLAFLSFSLFNITSVKAASASLIENSTWQGNLSWVTYSSIAWGDVNKDGNLDIVAVGCNDHADDCTESSYRIAKVYINNGTSLVENQTWQQNITGVASADISLGDIDNDGDLDLAVTGADSGGLGGNGDKSRVYINNGSTFEENLTWEQNFKSAFVNKGSITWGDVDGDGDLDLAVTGSDASNYDGIYINNGTSLVLDSRWSQGIEQDFRTSATWLDIDNDNDLDLIIIGYTSGNTYINNGTSLVKDDTWLRDMAGKDWVSTAFGDINNDGKMDFFSKFRKSMSC